jgi:hypothetical protein
MFLYTQCSWLVLYIVHWTTDSIRSPNVTKEETREMRVTVDPK